MNQFFYHHIGRDSMYKIWHQSGDNYLIYMYSDGGNIVFEDKIYPIKKGALCFIGGKKMHYTMPSAPEVYDRSKLSVTEEEQLLILSLFSDKNDFCGLFSKDRAVYALIPEKVQPEVERLIDEINNYKNDKKHFETKLICNYINLLIYIDKYTNDERPVQSGFAYNTLEYINSHISENITIDDICRHIHMSKYHFCRKFKSTTGVSVMEYILKTRIAKSRTMLTEKDMSITNAAVKCGFASVSYFCRVFKEQTGKTPLEYKKTEK